MAHPSIRMVAALVLIAGSTASLAQSGGAARVPLAPRLPDRPEWGQRLSPAQHLGLRMPPGRAIP